MSHVRKKHQDFHVLDVDGDGVLNSVELEQGLQWLGMKWGNNQTLVGVALFYLVYLGVPTKQYSHFIGGYKLTTPRNNANLVKLARDRKHDVFWPPNFGSF